MPIDWTNQDNRNLLWRAWPAGCLPTQGVWTLGEYICLVTSSPEFADWWRYSDDSRLTRRDEISMNASLMNGYLLPEVDIEDVCTWAAVLRDATTVARLNPEGRLSVGSEGFNPNFDDPTRWMLSGKGSSRTFDTPYDVPELALVYVIGEYRSGNYEERRQERIREFLLGPEPQTDRLALLMDEEESDDSIR
jgi:hypothetical protein